MGCETCGDKKPACDKGFTKATLEIKNPSQLVEFRKIVVPASLGDDTAVPPVVGKYCNAILYYEANNQVYIYSSDGIPTKLTTDVGNLQEQITAEVQARTEADTEIWEEIEAIEASSDVVDVVGTYAELQQYDTSKLHDNDLIKVLQDETHDDAITYYRWNDTTNTFSYVGEEGPYYTASETDVLLSAKQDAATAVSTVEVDQDESMTIYLKDSNNIVVSSAIVPDFVGATPDSVGYSGLVPQPDGHDIGRFLKGDGTWADVATNTIFYMNSSESGGTRHIFKDSAMTTMATSQEVFDANDKGQVILRISTSVDPDQYSDAYLQNAYKATGDYQLLFLDEKTYRSFDTTTLSASTFTYSARVIQDQLTAGSNITISGATISATDTTYSAFVGATSSVAGSAGLVPAPTTSDPSKFLKGDGTWDTPTDTTYSAGANIQINGTTISATDTTYSDFTGATSLVAGAHGLVPAPTTSDPDKYLKGDGTWASLPAANNISSNDWSALWQ